MTRTITALVLLTLVALPVAADDVTPDSLELSNPSSTSGANSFPFMEASAISFQQVVDDSEFSGPINIGGIGLRPDFGFSAGPFTNDYSSYVVTMSTTTASPTALSTTFATNVTGPVTTVLSGPLTLTATPNTTSFGVPGELDFSFELLFTTPFAYTPSPGSNLLIEVRHTAATGASSGEVFFDATAGASPVQGRVFSTGSSTAVTGTFSTSGGLVINWIAVTPEPTSFALFGLALAGAALARRRRSDEDEGV